MPVGTQLIRDLVNSRHMTSIHIYHRYTGYRTLHATNAANKHVGAGTRINFNPNLRRCTFADNWEGGASFPDLQLNHISLGHELIHAYRASRGMRVHGDEHIPHSFQDLDGRWVTDFRHTREELETIGIRFFDSRFGNRFLGTLIGVNENALRAEHGLARRVSWSPVACE